MNDRIVPRLQFQVEATFSYTITSDHCVGQANWRFDFHGLHEGTSNTLREFFIGYKTCSVPRNISGRLNFCHVRITPAHIWIGANFDVIMWAMMPWVESWIVRRQSIRMTLIPNPGVRVWLPCHSRGAIGCNANLRL